MAGVLGHSLALLADSAHMFADSLTYAVSLYAEYQRAVRDKAAGKLVACTFLFSKLHLFSISYASF